jgi:hypothetical protein
MSSGRDSYAQRPRRVMVDAPQPAGGVANALRDTFRAFDDTPCDMIRLLDRLRAVA